MNDQHSKWQTKELARTFLNDVRGAIPGACFQMEVLSKIVSMWCPQPTRILDLGCGDGALGRMLLDLHPAVHMVFADFSEPMLEALRKQINGNQRTTVINLDFSSSLWMNCLNVGHLFDAIVSGFAIHHQPDDRKRDLYAEIYGLLRGGGVFLNLEHVRSATTSGSALFDSNFVDHLLQFHANSSPSKTRHEIEESYYQRPDKKENILAPVETQCQWLREIGFQDVDCFFKVFELALFGGRKAANSGGHLTAE
jgi:tRNA (cmo5U34)-methyltransferase